MRLLSLAIAGLLMWATLASAETIHYKISRMGVSGKGDLTWVGDQKRNDRDTMLVTFKATGFNFNDEEDIYLDPKSYKPLFVERDINILGRHEKITEDYTHEGEIRIIKHSDGKTDEQVIKKRDVDNIYGFIYRYRKEGSFKLGDAIDVNLPTKRFKIRVAKKTKITVAGKSYDAFLMLSDPAQYKIWFDTSDQKLPLRISGGGNMIMTGISD